MSDTKHSVFFRAIRNVEPEWAHRLAITFLSMAPGLGSNSVSYKELETTVCGLKFPNPVGLAAGFDKSAKAYRGLFNWGAGFVEVGTITPKPQKGNARPRVFRLEEDFAIINRYGFNNDGLEAISRRLTRDVGRRSGIVGANIGMNRGAIDPYKDYVVCAERLCGLVDYITVNVSSPNTPGLRGLQSEGHLRILMRDVKQAVSDRSSGKTSPPLFLKISPDEDERSVATILNVCQVVGVDGLVISNTTINRDGSLVSSNKDEIGGLSGRPLKDRSLDLLRFAARESHGEVPLIGVGGIEDARDAYERIKAGASLVQLYTALIFKGPGLIAQIKKDLVELLWRDKLKSIGEAVGIEREVKSARRAIRFG